MPHDPEHHWGHRDNWTSRHMLRLRPRSDSSLGPEVKTRLESDATQQSKGKALKTEWHTRVFAIHHANIKHQPMERINSKELVCNFKRKIAGNHFFPYDTSSSDEVRTINTPNKSSQFEFLHNWEDFPGILSTIPRRDSEGMLFKSKDTFINLIRSLLSSVWWQK